MFSGRLRYAGVALVLLLARPATAADEPPSLESVAIAKQLIRDGKVIEARQLLIRLAERYEDSDDVDFLLGLLAVQSQDYRQGARHFRAILARHPRAVRVRLELGRALFLSRDFANASRQFQLARAGRLPPGVTANIDRFLAQIRQHRRWSSSFGLSIAPDTNINTGTSAREAVMFGIPFELGSDARKKSGTGVVADGSTEYTHRISDTLRFRVGGAFRVRQHRGSTFDEQIAAVHAGPRLVVNKWDVGLTATGFRRRLGGRRLSQGIEAKADAIYYSDPRTAFVTRISAQKVRYPDYPLHDGTGISAWAEVRRALTPDSFVGGQIGIAKSKTKAPELGSTVRSIALSYYRELPAGYSVYLEPSYSQARYHAVDPFFGERRKDRLFEFRLGVLNRRIDVRGFTPRALLTVGKRQSSIDLYDYTQRKLEIGLTREF